MATMTITEAKHIIDVVATALIGTGHRYHPVSALKGYDILQISNALKLRIAGEFLYLTGRDDFHEQFKYCVQLCGTCFYCVTSTFVPDNQVDEILADRVLDMFHNEKVGELETEESFGNYCAFVGANDPAYWRKIYARIGLEYTSTSPKGNDLAFLVDLTPPDSTPSWQLRCCKCGFVRDAKQAGHIRIGGWSWLRYVLGRCPRCRRLWFHAFERPQETDTTGRP
ncbi:MAG: hypothetical protein IT443_12845 [Phycisphaeraceae bacterium]|nr:hypothetical protein [Phycisphaeraceae bacterium]